MNKADELPEDGQSVKQPFDDVVEGADVPTTNDEGPGDPVPPGTPPPVPPTKTPVTGH